MKITKKILVVLCIVLFLCCFAAATFYITATAGIRLNENKLQLTQFRTQILDVNDREVKNILSTSHRETVPFDCISPYVTTALIDTEDRRFFSHRGFDVKRMLKAVYKNVTSQSFKEGASTISQQLIKNTHLTQDKTLERKMKELKLTAQLEKKYSKEQILEKYLNTIYFGHSCFGIDSAAAFYFQKSPDALDLADSAILAGLIKSPNNYSPFKNPKKCQARKASVLKTMLSLGHISQKEFEDAQRKPLPQKQESNLQNGGYFDLLFDEMEQLSEKYAFPISGNLRIDSYFSPTLQEQFAKSAHTITSDKSMIAIENNSGGIQAYYASVGEIERTPASLIKPLLVYAPALEEGIISPATPILDEKIDFDGYSPQNYDQTFHGYISVRESIAKSYNVPAVKTLNSLGVDKAAGYMQKLHLPVNAEDKSLALALGGMKTGYTLRNLANAYTVFACGGEWQPAKLIRAIYVDGRCLYQATTSKTSVFSPSTAFLISDMLKTTAQTGTAKKLRSLPFPIAAKTGTAGSSQGNTDAYAIAYTPTHTVGVWTGHANNDKIEYTGGGQPCETVKEIFEHLYATLPANTFTDFLKPTTVTQAKLDKLEYYDTHNIVLADDFSPPEYTFSEYFSNSTLPRKKSDKFSIPRISPPKLSYEKGETRIIFDKNTPSYYQYIIERYDYDRHITLYQGEKLNVFHDNNLQENKNYVYTVTPVYQNVKGTPVVLPTVSTKFGEIPPPPIVKDEWWKY